MNSRFLGRWSVLYSPEGGGSGAAAGADGGTGNAGNAGNAGDPWFKGVAGADEAMVGYWQNRGWHTKTAAEVAIEASKAHREATTLLGAPANELIRIPKVDAPEADRNAFYQRLGAPADPKDYLEGIKTIKLADGKDLDQQTVDFAQKTAAALHLPKAAAPEFTKALVAHLEGLDKEGRAEAEAKLATEKSALAKNWGANAPAFKLVAQRAAEALGVDAEAVAALEKVVGYSKVMNLFLSVGQKIGEDKFISGGNPGLTGNAVMTREQAAARKSELMSDRAWTDRYSNGDKAALSEMLALNSIIVGVAA